MGALSLSDFWSHANGMFLGIYISDDQVNIDAVKINVHGHHLQGCQHLEARQNMLVVDTVSAWAEYRDTVGGEKEADGPATFDVTIPVTQ